MTAHARVSAIGTLYLEAAHRVGIIAAAKYFPRDTQN